MAVSFVAAGAWAASGSTSTAAAPALPAGWAVGDFLLLTVAWKQTGASLTAPVGWTTITNSAASFNGSGYGAGAGDVNVATFYRVATTGQTAPTILPLTGGSTNNTSGNVMLASVVAFRSSLNTWVLPGATGGQTDSDGANFDTSTTAWSHTGNGSVAADIASGDMIHVGLGMSLSTATQSNHNWAMSGLTVGARTVAPTKGSSTVGADLGATTYYAAVTAGARGVSDFASAVTSVTQSAATYGCGVWTRIRDANPVTANPRPVQLVTQQARIRSNLY